MKRQAHWTTLVPWLALTWCAEVVVTHYWVPYTWERALHAGLFQIPVLAGIGYGTHRRAKRRSQQPPLTSAQAPR